MSQATAARVRAQATNGAAAAAEAIPETVGPSPRERWARGREERGRVRRRDHAAWDPPSARADPVEVLQQQETSRVPELVPIRHGRMLESPFSFFRGAAAVMAADLAGTPSTDLRVQLC